MVLQRQVDDRGATLWGYAAAVGDDITVEIEELSQTWSTTAQTGKWSSERKQQIWKCDITFFALYINSYIPVLQSIVEQLEVFA